MADGKAENACKRRENRRERLQEVGESLYGVQAPCRSNQQCILGNAETLSGCAGASLIGNRRRLDEIADVEHSLAREAVRSQIVADSGGVPYPCMNMPVVVQLVITAESRNMNRQPAPSERYQLGGPAHPRLDHMGPKLADGAGNFPSCKNIPDTAHGNMLLGHLGLQPL